MNKRNDSILEEDSRRKRRSSQIIDTIIFEFQRFGKKTGILLAVAIAIFGLSLVIGLLTLDRNPLAFSTVESYIRNYLSYMNMLILILATSYGTGMIVIDFQENTGNLLFPKISRSRLLIGRIIGNFLLGALIILIYYLISIIPVFIKFEALPKEYWYSLGFSLYYYLALLSLAVFFSSFVKRSSG
ncbi:MAG: ABC transporter permease, partial [Promethearchaeota archaeon]